MNRAPSVDPFKYAQVQALSHIKVTYVSIKSHKDETIYIALHGVYVTQHEHLIFISDLLLTPAKVPQVWKVVLVCS